MHNFELQLTNNEIHSSSYTKNYSSEHYIISLWVGAELVTILIDNITVTRYNSPRTIYFTLHGVQCDINTIDILTKAHFQSSNFKVLVCEQSNGVLSEAYSRIDYQDHMRMINFDFNGQTNRLTLLLMAIG